MSCPNCRELQSSYEQAKRESEALKSEERRCIDSRLEAAEKALAEAKKAGEEMAHLYSSACADLRAAESEAARLRGALERIERGDKAVFGLGQEFYGHAMAIARAALAQDKP